MKFGETEVKDKRSRRGLVRIWDLAKGLVGGVE